VNPIPFPEFNQGIEFASASCFEPDLPTNGIWLLLPAIYLSNGIGEYWWDYFGVTYLTGLYGVTPTPGDHLLHTEIADLCALLSQNLTIKKG